MNSIDLSRARVLSAAACGRKVEKSEKL